MLNMLAKLNSSRIRHSNEHELWLFTSATISCSARFAVVNICLEQQKCQGNASSAERLSSPTPQECMYQQQHFSPSPWLQVIAEKLWFSIARYTDRQLMHEEVKSRRLSLPMAQTSISDFYVTLPQRQFPLISPSSDRSCAVTEEYQPLGNVGCRISVALRFSVHTCIVLQSAHKAKTFIE